MPPVLLRFIYEKTNPKTEDLCAPKFGIFWNVIIIFTCAFQAAYLFKMEVNKSPQVNTPIVLKKSPNYKRHAYLP